MPRQRECDGVRIVAELGSGGSLLEAVRAVVNRYVNQAIHHRLRAATTTALRVLDAS